MTWNYRIIEFPETSEQEGYRALHEVHYDDDKKPVSYSAEPATFGEGVHQDGDVAKALEMALACVRKYPVLLVSVFDLPLSQRPATPRMSELT